MKYRLGLYEKSMPGSFTIREKLMTVKRLGFDYMELSVDETDEKQARLDWTDEEIREVRDAVFETGVPIYSLCLSAHRKYPFGHPDAEVREKSLVIMQKAVILAYRLGVRVIQLAGYDVYYVESTEETAAFFLESLKKAVVMAAEYGVTLAFETMETPFMNTVEKAMKSVDAVKSPWLQVYPDIGNLTNAALTGDRTVTEDLETGRGHIAAVHLKETVPGVFREVPLGTGHVDFVADIKKCLDLGVRTFVGELWYTGRGHYENDLVHASEFLHDKMDRAVALCEAE